MSVELVDYAGLAPGERQALGTILAPLGTLERVLDWGRGLSPAVDIDEILTQDEYTHDVVFRLADNRYLVFDTT